MMVCNGSVSTSVPVLVPIGIGSSWSSDFATLDSRKAVGRSPEPSIVLVSRIEDKGEYSVNNRYISQ